MVGRFIEEQDVGDGGQRLRQEHAAFHARGKYGHVGVRIELHSGKDRLDLLVHPPAAADLQGLLDAIHCGVQFRASLDGQLMTHAVVFGKKLRTGPQPERDLIENRARQIPRHVLGKYGRDEPLLPGDFAAVRFNPAVNDAQQRRLARSIAAQQADPFPGLKLKIDLIEHQGAAKAQTHVAQRHQRHGA